MQQQKVVEPGVMFGLTHELDGTPRVRVPKLLKVGIGLPRGPALNVFIHNDRKWWFRMGKYEGNKLKFETVAKLDTRQAAEAFYRDNVGKADICKYPRKISFFTFTRPTITERGDEVFEPDWEAIEAAGVMPTELDIVFMDDNPFSGAYQMWSQTELRCKGDGINALRVLSMAAESEREIAQQAAAAGQKYFPIIGGCWTADCGYAGKECKPGGDLRFQLVSNLRVGGNAYFHTTGMRSISQLFSSLYQIKSLTGGRLAGLALKLVLRPYRTNHEGKPATQYGVSLEVRAESMERLRQNLIEQTAFFAPRQIERAAPKMIDAPADEVETPISARAITAEFYPEVTEAVDGEPDDEQPPEAPAASPSATTAAAATQAKTEGLAEKMRRSRKGMEAAAAVAPAPTPVATPAATPVAEASPAPPEAAQDMF